jgi:hypothetical protein
VKEYALRSIGINIAMQFHSYRICVPGPSDACAAVESIPKAELRIHHRPASITLQAIDAGQQVP